MLTANLKIRLSISALLLAMFCTVAAAKTIYVDGDAAGANDGTSWTDAYTFLQEALAAANLAEKPVEIRVAQGIYRPNQGLVAIPEFDWRTTTFQLINDVVLKGGYAGFGEPDPNARDIELYETILSGDLNGDDGPDFTNNSDNSYYVVTGSNTDETAVMDGLIIIGGADSGMYNTKSRPTLTNCTFMANSSKKHGGGMFNDNSNPTLTNCLFRGNAAPAGGGIYNTKSSPTLINCTFIENSTAIAFVPGSGGGMYNIKSKPILINCTFSRNRAGGAGGMANFANSNPSLTNCAFSENYARYGGGGMLNSENSSPLLTNCTFSGNLAEGGDGMENSLYSNPILTNCTFSRNGILNKKHSSPSLANCIIWGGADLIWNDSGSTIMVSYSDVQGGFPGEGNIDADPLFANTGYWDPNGTPKEPNDDFWIEGDYHLKSEAGRWDPNSQSWVRDDVTSPCIDAGDPNSDWSGETWPHGERINMGAYGGTRQAGMSTQPQSMFLPRIAYIYLYDAEAAESFRSLLVSYGCSTTLIALDEVTAAPLASYDLIIVADDTQFLSTWNDPQTVVAIETSDKPVVGLGEGGYDFFGVLGLSIGRPNGGHGERNSISVIDPNCSLFSTPYPVDIPEDQNLQLYTETSHVGLYLWPVPETVTALGAEVDDPGYYPLALEHNRYLLWGFTESPQKMTEVGKILFVNVVIWTANAGWEIEI